jgi:hypothetical protein
MPGRAPYGVPITTLRLKPVDEEGSRQYYRNLEARERRNANIIKNENDPRNIGGTGGRSSRISSSAQDSAETQRLRARQDREKLDANRNDPRNTGGNRKSPASPLKVTSPKYDKATKFAIGLTSMGQAMSNYKKLNSIKASSPPKAAEKVKTDGSALSSMKEDMKTSAKVVRGGRDYMGETFDATLRRGVSKGRDYLKSQMAKDNVSDKEQKAMLSRFEAKFAKDQALTSKEDGLVAGYEKGGDAKRLLDAYRKKGGYRKNATASEVASLARGK